MTNPSHSPGGTGELFPDATLATLDGGELSLDSYRPRHDLVLVMLGEGGIAPSMARLLDELARDRGALEAEDAKVVAIAAADRAHAPERWSWPFPLLLDDAGRLHARSGATDAAGRPAPALFVTDRYREIYGKLRPGEPGWPESTTDVLEWLTFVNIQCPECSVPEW